MDTISDQEKQIKELRALVEQMMNNQQQQTAQAAPATMQFFGIGCLHRCGLHNVSHMWGRTGEFARRTWLTWCVPPGAVSTHLARQFPATFCQAPCQWEGGARFEAPSRCFGLVARALSLVEGRWETTFWEQQSKPPTKGRALAGSTLGCSGSRRSWRRGPAAFRLVAPLCFFFWASV